MSASSFDFRLVFVCYFLVFSKLILSCSVLIFVCSVFVFGIFYFDFRLFVMFCSVHAIFLSYFDFLFWFFGTVSYYWWWLTDYYGISIYVLFLLWDFDFWTVVILIFVSYFVFWFFGTISYQWGEWVWLYEWCICK